MVNRFLFFVMLIPFFLFSGEFVATVDQNKVYLGETFSLNLTLKGAQAKDYPSTRLLKQAFFVQSQHQASSTTIVNGVATSSVTWKIMLIPQEEGKWEIPSITIGTNEGTLSTEPIFIEVLKGTSSNLSNVEGVEFTATLSNDKPYKNEPVLYTLKLSSNQQLANLQLEKIQIEDAILEANGDPKISSRVINGIHVDVAEFSYLITPLKAGPLKIPSATIQGGIPNRRRGYASHSLDPFLMMQGFDRLESFSLRSQEFTMEVQPPVAGMNPWLPASSLKIEEIFNDKESIQVGNPFNRTFKISGEGIRSDQLPHLSDYQGKGDLFKIYADHPELTDEVKFGMIQSSRKEQYTLIPQQEGALTLPEISLVWWDVSKKEKKIATIPSRILHVIPSVQEKPISTLQKQEEKLEEPKIIVQKDPVLYAIIVALGFLLIGAICFGFLVQKKLASLKEKPKQVHQKKTVRMKKSIKKDRKEKLPDLNPT